VHECTRCEPATAAAQPRTRCSSSGGFAPLSTRPTRPKADRIGADDLGVRRRSSTVPPGRFHLHGLDVEVEPAEGGLGWRARVMTPAVGPEWRHGRRAWDAIDAAVLAHLAAAPADETYLRLLVAA
jgi:hypothetical protein